MSRKTGNATHGASASFKGNKQYLPVKPCVACGRDMVWRKSWAKNWESVKYCSEACRRLGDPCTASNELKKSTGPR